MKIKYLSLLPLLLISCNGDNNGLKTICPTGAPSLIFYDQGNNKNILFHSDSKQIIAQFQTLNYDAIVIDATNGLEQIKIHKDTTPFRLAKLLTSGNLYLISYKYDSLPTSNNTLISFGNIKSIPHLVTNKLNEEWKITSNNIEYKDNVQQVLMVAKNNPNISDYIIIAEPALTALTSTHKDVKKIWKLKDLLNSEIPQAALFINKNKVNEFKSYFEELNTRIDVTINHPDIVKSKLDEYSKEPSDIATKFGIASSDIVYKIQNGEGGSLTKNGFAIYEKDKKFTSKEINNFLDLVNYDSTIRYTEDYFINI